MKNVWIVCTMDTKAQEGLFLKKRLADMGVSAKLVDTGAAVMSPAQADITNVTVAAAAGYDADQLFKAVRRMDAISCLADGLKICALEASRKGELAGIIAIGGSGGMSLASGAFCALPFGLPKIMVTTVASGNMRPYIGGKDVLVLNPVADIAGLNDITKTILSRAAAAMCGMLSDEQSDSGEKAKNVAITGFGSTDKCVSLCRKLLTEAGYEPVAFHARGVSGGTVMEELIADGWFCGVLDITTTEIADMVAGGIYPSNKTRLDYLGSVPTVVAPGAMDMVNFGGRSTVPAEFDDRTFVAHGVATTLMRTNKQELKKAADFMVKKISGAENTVVLIPQGGFSSYDAPEHDFYDPETNQVFIDTLISETDKTEIMDCNINHPQFAHRAVELLIKMMEGKK